MTQTGNPLRLKKFWQERVVALIIAQVTQGFTPRKIALSIALGFSLGIFPILGATTVLCAIIGLSLRLNQPVIQLANWLAAPLQPAMILIFVRIGERIVHAPPVSFSIPELVRTFHESPLKFLQEFGLTGLHGFLAWLAIAPFLTALVYFILLTPLEKLARLNKQNAD